MAAKTVWVIEKGSYSDYRVVGVFSTKENAEAVMGAINAGERYDAASLAEWTLDPGAEEINAGLSQWKVLMLRDGTTEYADATTYLYDLAGSHHIWERTKAMAYRNKPDVKDALDATVWAKDKKHAVKIVNEIRTRMIANNEWKA